MAKTLVVQLQSEYLTDDLFDFAVHQLKEIENDIELSVPVRFIYGEESDRYVNIEFESSDVKHLWNIIKKKLFEDDMTGGALKRCVIVVCQGNSGWNDYLMLYHYDDSVEIDEI